MHPDNSVHSASINDNTIGFFISHFSVSPPSARDWRRVRLVK
jgi:hypothetical protein